ncbi:MAG: FHA domain-containing protein [Anaerolineales bacterium]|nr:FHA domain-containing protein [Anaerolineales bacterium]
MSGPVLLVLRFLLALGLYAFLAWAFLNLWRDLRQQSALLATRRVPPISLTIASTDQPPQVRHFKQPEITIGRDPACECPLDEETVSTRHARLSYHHGQWWLEDLDSTNGTLLNQERLSTPTVVISGDEIGCGNACLTVTLSGDMLMPPTQKI